MERALPLGIFLCLAACEPFPPAPTSDRAPLLRPAATPAGVPAGSLRHRVKSVYDGDTLTLEDNRKVRLLAVDTPEIKEQQPLAPEARDLARRYCQDREVWLEFDAEKEDRYGRWLCYVYVEADGRVLMVNAELLRQGLARFYTPGPNLRHADSLLACQREAREHSRGTWKDYVLARPKKVLATRKGRAYHREGCDFIKDSKELRTLQEKEALDLGLSACRECKP